MKIAAHSFPFGCVWLVCMFHFKYSTAYIFILHRMSKTYYSTIQMGNNKQYWIKNQYKFIVFIVFNLCCAQHIRETDFLYWTTHIDVWCQHIIRSRVFFSFDLYKFVCWTIRQIRLHWFWPVVVCWLQHQKKNAQADYQRDEKQGWVHTQSTYKSHFIVQVHDSKQQQIGLNDWQNDINNKNYIIFFGNLIHLSYAFYQKKKKPTALFCASAMPSQLKLYCKNALIYLPTRQSTIICMHAQYSCVHKQQ